MALIMTNKINNAIESTQDMHDTGMCNFKHLFLEKKLKCVYLMKYSSTVNMHVT